MASEAESQAHTHSGTLGKQMWRRILDWLLPLAPRAQVPLQELRLALGVQKAMISHVQQEDPYAASGLLSGTGGRVTSARPLRNLYSVNRARSEFVSDPDDLNDALQEIEARGLKVMGIYASASDDLPEPSSATIANLWMLPEAYYVAVRVSEPFTLRAFIISEGQAREVPITPCEIEETLETVRRQFEFNACLAMFTWVETFNHCLQVQDRKGAHQLLDEVQGGGYVLWPAAKQAIGANEQLLNQQEHGQSETRNESGLALLIKTLDDSSRDLQREAVLALGYLRQVQVLGAALTHRQMVVRMMAAGVLRRCGADVVPVFREALSNQYWFVRWQAVQHLGMLRDISDVPALIAALNDADVDVREAAIQALGRWRDHSAIANLQALLPTSVRDSNGRRLDGVIRDALLDIDGKPA